METGLLLGGGKGGNMARSMPLQGGHTMTYHELLEAYLTECEAKASYPMFKRMVDQHLKQWPDYPSFIQISDWRKSLVKNPHRANKGLVFLKAMFTWAMRRGMYPGPNPATGVPIHAVQSRDRVMSTQELTLLIGCLDMVEHQKLATILTVFLTTGCRLSEATSMKWEHINMVTGIWWQPKTKNGRPHRTYLPTQTRQAIASLPKKGEYVFMGAYDHCWSRAGVEKTWRQTRGSLGLIDVRLHDFRRTLASHLYRHTKDEYLVKRCINHVNKSVTAIYVRISDEEVSLALQAQADRFFALNTAPAPVQTWSRRESDRKIEGGLHA